MCKLRLDHRLYKDMAECRNPGQVDGLEDILKTKPSVERDQRIRELVAALAKERDTLKDHLSIVEVGN